ncbi:hypothetical protein [Maribacter sp. 1_MG-2023]|uniref:hypothetical protein n=1 Tax=Maribacter sp. 1_MG-2023 TaxID=3062677 RepID=UPI0026E1C052|nr:hypothetical protein [Maribacter sp. 1_MG-2023]MDO6472354.1 hypothetical protein [Maribacter sp. 1_MG-2023]
MYSKKGARVYESQEFGPELSQEYSQARYMKAVLPVKGRIRKAQFKNRKRCPVWIFTLEIDADKAKEELHQYNKL